MVGSSSAAPAATGVTATISAASSAVRLGIWPGMRCGGSARGLDRARHADSRPPTEDEDAGRDEVERPAGCLEGGRPRPVAEERGEESADAAAVVEEPRAVPERLARRQHAERLELAESGAEQAGRHQQEQPR